MSAHTPIPFALPLRIVPSRVDGPSFVWVMDTPVGEARRMRFRAEEAEFIVRACNNHDALVKALQEYQQASAMKTYGDASDFVWPSVSAKVPGQHAYGFICEKHGLGYQSGCICCRDDFDAHSKEKDRQARDARNDALERAERNARAALTAAGAA